MGKGHIRAMFMLCEIRIIHNLPRAIPNNNQKKPSAASVRKASEMKKCIYDGL
jgi:hypothetical protein